MKTITGTLAGRQVGLEFFRVALSTVVCKQMGETEKNLASLFGRARGLPFDVSGALLTNRAGAKDAHDRYANLKSSYLLQTLEDFDVREDPDVELEDKHGRGFSASHQHLDGAT